jgi:hypothetical protein
LLILLTAGISSKQCVQTSPLVWRSSGDLGNWVCIAMVYIVTWNGDSVQALVLHLPHFSQDSFLRGDALVGQTISQQQY